MKLTYWIAECLNDAPCYSLIGKTKKSVVEQVEQNPHGRYAAPIKREIEYKDAFDLFEMLTGEGGGRVNYW